jgi:hypothetical protein
MITRLVVRGPATTDQVVKQQDARKEPADGAHTSRRPVGQSNNFHRKIVPRNHILYSVNSPCGCRLPQECCSQHSLARVVPVLP